jgi:hypothetical protein
VFEIGYAAQDYLGAPHPRMTPAVDMVKKESGTVHSGEGEVSSAAF